MRTPQTDLGLTLLFVVPTVLGVLHLQFYLFVKVCREMKVLAVSDESNLSAEAFTHFKHSLLESCGPLRLVRMSMKAETLTPEVFSPDSNRVYR